MNRNYETWKRPCTTRRYIHPPKAERMFTIWKEGKVILGQIEKGIDWRSYKYLTCSGFWLVRGEGDEQFDFHHVENILPENGIPFHGLRFNCGDLRILLETFCNIDRKPTCFARIRIENTGKEAVHEPLALLLRSGQEKKLVFASPDEYASYAPDVSVWKDTDATWRCVQHSDMVTLVDEDVFLTAQGLPVTWEEKSGTLRLPSDYAAGETAELILSFGKGIALPFDIEQERENARVFWVRELSRITKLPKGFENNHEQIRMVQNLTVQLLQCFCYRVGENNLLSRQGGLQRLIWPWEATSSLEALGMIGDFSDYIEPVLSMYFDVMQAPDGEIRPIGEGWACITAAVLYSFARYCMDVSKRFYWKYRDAAMAAFQWIKNTRKTTENDPHCIAGLFPPKRANDWGQEYQGWMTTDIVNAKGLKYFAEAAERFGDADAGAVREEADDYLHVMRCVMQKFVDEAGDSDILRIPLTPDGNDAQLLADYYPYFNFGKFTALGVVKDVDIQRVLNYLISANIYGNGLYGYMPHRNNDHIWYTNLPDYYWFLTWLRTGEHEKAQAVIDAQIKYSMTDEYYMVERYVDNDPYYVPWSPNASANGRTIIMLVKQYCSTICNNDKAWR